MWLPGAIEDDQWMLVGSRHADECQWRPAVRISEEVSEVLWAFATGRTIEGRRKARIDGKVGFREPSEILMNDYTGLCSEYAVAKYLGVPFELRYDPGNQLADIGYDIQVRGTTYLHGGLIIRPHEKHRAARHVLGVLHGQHVAIVGWADGSDVVSVGESHEWWHPNGYWLVPGLQTRAMSEFTLPARDALRWV